MYHIHDYDEVMFSGAMHFYREMKLTFIIRREIPKRAILMSSLFLALSLVFDREGIACAVQFRRHKALFRPSANIEWRSAKS